MKKIKYQMKSKTLRGSLTEMMLEVYCRTDSTVFLENIRAVSYTHLIKADDSNIVITRGGE